MKNLKFLFFIFAIFTLSSCTQNETIRPINGKNANQFYSTGGNNYTAEQLMNLVQPGLNDSLNKYGQEYKSKNGQARHIPGAVVGCDPASYCCFEATKTDGTWDWHIYWSIIQNGNFDTTIADNYHDIMIINWSDAPEVLQGKTDSFYVDGEGTLDSINFAQP